MLIALWLAAAAPAFAREPVAITPRDLSTVVESTSVASLRKLSPTLTSKQFRTKLKAALRSPQHLKQTFPGLLGTMVEPLIGTRRLPGKTAPIAFDAHVENTGTIRLAKGRSIAGVIDLDDSGVGPASVDALSIGAALRQGDLPKHVLEEAFDAFAEAATSRSTAPLSVKGPAWGKLRRAFLEEHVRVTKDGDHAFKKGPDVSRATYAAIVDAAGQNAVLRDYVVEDIVGNTKSTGGSAELLRYRLLAKARNSDERRVFDLKEIAPPAAATLGVRQPTAASRLGVLERALWNDTPDHVLFDARVPSLPGRDAPAQFLVADAFSIVGNDAKRHDDAIEAAAIYGRAHAGQFGRMTAAELASWMKDSSQAVKGAFDALHGSLRSELKKR